MNEIVLDTKIVGDITGTFFVPSYQGGYRWGKEEVERLLLLSVFYVLSSGISFLRY
ncbi:MAG: hypothetical protein MR409_03090 [Lachnospiraceae bacterium]|nr:hypothetical protein [Lachnospiraceae bacterium]